jgi:AraC-like DNA-binding protein
MTSYHVQVAPPVPGSGYRQFLRRLHQLLHQSGIGPARSTIVCSAEEGPGLEAAPSIALTMGEIRHYIDRHAHEVVGLEQLSERANLSKYHFTRVFREATGVTPWTYVREARLRRAKSLLDEGRSLAEVAQEAGFYDQSHLTHAFKAVEGVTPGAYRKEQAAEVRKDLQDDDAMRT